jgi:hypothetical protein
MQEIPEIGLVIHDLIGGNSQYIDEYLAVYEELLPQYIHYAPVMRRRAENLVDESTIEMWHQWLLMIEHRPVGIIGFLYNKNRNTAVLLDFAIKSEARKIHVKDNQRFAKLCLELAMRQLIRDAQDIGHRAPLCMIAEVEYVSLVEKYKKYGYVALPLEYFEPPYTPDLLEVSARGEMFDKIEYRRMYVGAFQIPGHPFDPHSPDIIKTILLTLLEDHYHLPADHWLVQKMLHEIPV